MRFLLSILFIVGITFISNESFNQPQYKPNLVSTTNNKYILVSKHNILIGDSQTPFIAKWSYNATLLNKVGSESSLWKGGIGLNWLKLAVTNYKLDTLIQSVTFCIGTNGRFSSKDDIIGLVDITKKRFPNAYLYVIQGSWGWGGNVNVTKSLVDSYYTRFNQLGVKVIEPPIGKCEPHNANLPQYKEIAKNLDSLISKQR
jgi:hypothetical protein